MTMHYVLEHDSHNYPTFFDKLYMLINTLGCNKGES